MPPIELAFRESRTQAPFNFGSASMGGGVPMRGGEVIGGAQYTYRPTSIPLYQKVAKGLAAPPSVLQAKVDAIRRTMEKPGFLGSGDDFYSRSNFLLTPGQTGWYGMGYGPNILMLQGGNFGSVGAWSPGSQGADILNAMSDLAYWAGSPRMFDMTPFNEAQASYYKNERLDTLRKLLRRIPNQIGNYFGADPNTQTLYNATNPSLGVNIRGGSIFSDQRAPKPAFQSSSKPLEEMAKEGPDRYSPGHSRALELMENTRDGKTIRGEDLVDERQPEPDEFDRQFALIPVERTRRFPARNQYTDFLDRVRSEYGVLPSL